mgnify:FL=1
MSWPKKTLVFDTETTGIDVFNDRIVQLFIGIADENGELIERHEWLIDPGIEVPEGASDVHGFTTEFLQVNGGDPEEVLQEAAGVFAQYADIPWVAFNANFDLSILYAEFTRHGVVSGWAETVLGTWNVQLIDGLVIDRAKDRYRKGKRKLWNMADTYGNAYDPDALHDAGADVELTAKVTRAIVNKYGIPSNAEQAEMYRAWAVNLEQFLQRSDPSASVDKDWPIKLKEGS